MSDLLEIDELKDGVWMRVSDLAKDRGITRQSMSERVRKLQASGSLTTRKDGRFVLVNVPEFDLAINQHGDGFAEQRVATRQDTEDSISPELRKSQALKAGYDAEMAKLKLRKEQGLVRSIDEIENAGLKAAELVLKHLDQLPSKADEIHKQIKDGNVNATRRLLKNITFEIRKELCEILTMQLEIERNNQNGNS